MRATTCESISRLTLSLSDVSKVMEHQRICYYRPRNLDSENFPLDCNVIDGGEKPGSGGVSSSTIFRGAFVSTSLVAKDNKSKALKEICGVLESHRD